MTGLTLRAAKRLQVNMELFRSNIFDVMKPIPEYTLFPVLWVEESAIIDDDNVDKLNDQIFRKQRVFKILMICLTVVGVCLAICGAALIYNRNRLEKLKQQTMSIEMRGQVNAGYVHRK